MSTNGLRRRAVDRIMRLPGVRRLRGDPRIHIRYVMVRAALAVTEPVRFALNELFLRRRVRAYRLRRLDRHLFVRHPLSDAWVVDEVLRRQIYRPPPEVARLLDALGRPPRIVDLGAHIGTTTLSLLEVYPESRVTAVEPNAASADLLRRTLAVNRLDRQCEVIQAAAGTEAATARIEGHSILAHFVRDGEREAIDDWPWLSKVHPPGPSQQVEVIDIFPVLADADLVKIDIEGAEWPILADSRMAGVGTALVLEYHPQGAPGESHAAAQRLLREAGFTTGAPHDQYGGVATLWAWRGD